MTAGLSISLTGKFARQGLDALRGAQLWAERSGVRLVYYDDESRAPRAAENALRLLEHDRVDVLLGPYSSGLALAVARVAEEHRKVVWNHGGSSDDVAGRWVVSTPSPASGYFRELPRWLAANAPGLRSLTVLRPERGAFAGHIARGLLKEAEAAGYSLQPSGGDVLVLAAGFEEEIRIVRSRPPARIVAAVAAGIGAFGEELGGLAESVIGPSQWEPGPESEWFVRGFRDRFGCVPEYMAAGAFAAGLILEACIRRAGSLEDGRLREAAAGLETETFYGRFRIDPGTGRQLGHRITLVRWERGRKVRISGT